ncbi:unnamed protein product [Lactuca saligna]|uniref:RING-type domain-containing protein n=1 Tax=Lactuca saligna TaxID=75948 RepID=A0AA36EGM5_LACSI|nr:unnamed protein product [Lactuca saligna]
MPIQKHSDDSLSGDEDDVELQRTNQNISGESEEDDVEQEEQAESDDDGSPSSSSSDKDEFVYVKLADVRKEVQCPICLGIIRKTRKVMECLHRFCRECIDKSMRLGNNECPACRAHCASRRSLRDDPNYDALIALLYPDIDKYEEEELAFHEEEKARNKQIQASIAQTSRRQLEALGKKRATAKATATAFMRRSQSNPRNLRGRKRQKSTEPQVSENDLDADNDNGDKYSSSTDEPEPSTEVKLKRYKRWSVGQSSSGNGICDANERDGIRKNGPEILAWGRGGMRSHTRHGGQSSGGGKIGRHGQISKLIDHLQKLPRNDDNLEIHLKLISLDEQNMPNLKKTIFVCCNPTMSTTNISQFVAHENNLQANEIELLLVKGDDSEHNLSPLEEHQILSDLVKTSSQNNLTIGYRKKLVVG